MVLSTLGGCDSEITSEDEAANLRKPIAVNAIEAKKVNEVVEAATYFGVLEPKRKRYLGFGIAGEIKMIADTNSFVSAGQVLAQLEQQDLQTQKRSLESQLKNLPSEQNEQVQRLRSQLERINAQIAAGTITTPFDCVVAETFADSGSLANSNTRILQVFENTNPVIKINLPSRIAQWLSNDQKINFLLSGKLTQAVLKRKAISENPVGSILVWFDVISDLNDTPWRFGQAIEIRFAESGSKSGFWIPIDALSQSTDGAWTVYVLVSNEADDRVSIAQVERRLVRVILHEDNRVLVGSGIVDGELLVANGLHRIANGQQVTVRMKSDAEDQQNLSETE